VRGGGGENVDELGCGWRVGVVGGKRGVWRWRLGRGGVVC